MFTFDSPCVVSYSFISLAKPDGSAGGLIRGKVILICLQSFKVTIENQINKFVFLEPSFLYPSLTWIMYLKLWLVYQGYLSTLNNLFVLQWREPLQPTLQNKCTKLVLFDEYVPLHESELVYHFTRIYDV